MSSPTRSSLFSPNSSRIAGRHDLDSSLASPRSPRDSRISTIIPETSVVSPRSTFSRSGLEDNIHSLQSKILLCIHLFGMIEIESSFILHHHH